MALFKVYRGNEENLPTKLTDGYAYFCADTGNFFIDYSVEGGKLYRKQLNAASASALHYEADGAMVEVDPATVALKEEVAQMVSIDQGVTEANKILRVGADGKLSPVTMSEIGATLTWGNLVGEN